MIRHSYRNARRVVALVDLRVGLGEIGWGAGSLR